jgi:hypothetical protein
VAHESVDDLVEQSCSSIERRSLAEASALLTRVTKAARDENGEASPRYRASLRLLRILREFLGDRVGAAIRSEDAAHEEELDEARFNYDAEGRAVYINLIMKFGKAAWTGLRCELARQFVTIAVDLCYWDAQQTQEFGRYAEIALWLGQISVTAGAYGPAYLIFEDIRRISTAGDCRQRWADAAVTGLGRTWLGFGEHSKGQTLLVKVLAEGPRDVSGWQDAMLDLYGSYLASDDFEAAQRCHETLIAVGYPGRTFREEIIARETERVNPSKAVALYQQIINPVPGQQLRSSALMRMSLRMMKLYLEIGSPEQGYLLLTETYPVFQEVWGKDHPAMSELEEVIARLEIALGRPEWALDVLFKATDRDSKTATLQLCIGSSAVSNRLLARMRRRTEAAVSLVAAHFPEEMKFIGGVFALINRRKGLGVNIEWQKHRQLNRAAAVNWEAEQVQAQLRSVRWQLARENISGKPDSPAELATINALLQTKEDLDNHASYLIGGVEVGSLTKEANPGSISMCIPENAIYIEFVKYRPLQGCSEGLPRYCVIVVRARYLKWNLVELGEASGIDLLVEQFRRTIVHGPVSDRSLSAFPDEQPCDAPKPSTPGHLLRKALFDPLLPLLGDRTRIVICPDGVLFSLAFECLPADEGGNLIDKYCITYVFSSRDAMYFDSEIIHGPEDADSCSPPVVMGCPDYGDVATGREFRFAPLPETEQEAKTVSSLLGVRALLGKEASRANLERVHSPLILHLASHGFLLPDVVGGSELSDMPLLRCGIALSGANVSGSGGIITGEEALSLDLSRTALAVLSACETGLGFAEHGEGLASLGRAFHTAGASTVLMALWKVPDQNTRELMELFYENLARGNTCADSLHNAKLEIRRRHSDIFDWGAFVCLGRWGSIAINSYSGR